MGARKGILPAFLFGLEAGENTVMRVERRFELRREPFRRLKLILRFQAGKLVVFLHIFDSKFDRAARFILDQPCNLSS